MDSLLEVEDSCVYCSKYLSNLNEFNKKMHMNTCKVRKLVESSSFALQAASSTIQTSMNNSSAEDSQQQQMEDEYLILGDSCSYCFKSFKDFKSDFNKRIHIKCCKIKKQTFEQKLKLNASLNNSGVIMTSTQGTSSTSAINNQSQNHFNSILTENCLFCSKTLSNLNEFNKKMHIENCKIRKSIEGHVYQRPPKNTIKNTLKGGEVMSKIAMELGNECLYCSKPFANLSEFNKKLHFDYCKLKKRKLNALVNASQHENNNNNGNNDGMNSSQQNNSMMNQSLTCLNHSINIAGNQGQNNNNNVVINGMGNNQNNSNNNNQNNSHIMMNTSLPNMHLQQQHHHLNMSNSGNGMLNMSQGSNPNLGINSISTMLDLGDICVFCSRSLCNLSNFNKKIHIEQCKVKQLKKASTIKVVPTSPTKPARKRAKKEKSELCQSIMTNLEMTTVNSNGNLNNNMNSSSLNTMLNGNIINLNGVLAASLSSQNNNHQMSQFEALATNLNLSGLDTATLHHVAMNNQVNNQAQAHAILSNANHLQLPIDQNQNNRIFI